MSGLVATAPTTPQQPISSGGWYPQIDPADARDIMRLDGTVTDARLVECLQVAMCSVEDLLECWQTQQLALGRTALDQVPSKIVGTESRLVLLYRRAVYACAQAELNERYSDVGTTDAARKRAEILDCTADDYRRTMRFAIRDILGRPRADVELI